MPNYECIAISFTNRLLKSLGGGMHICVGSVSHCFSMYMRCFESWDNGVVTLKVLWKGEDPQLRIFGSFSYLFLRIVGERTMLDLSRNQMFLQRYTDGT